MKVIIYLVGHCLLRYAILCNLKRISNDIRMYISINNDIYLNFLYQYLFYGYFQQCDNNHIHQINVISFLVSTGPVIAFHPAVGVRCNAPPNVKPIRYFEVIVCINFKAI
jgi:hypothetical protein